VLANVVRKPLAQIFSEFSGKQSKNHTVIIGTNNILPFFTVQAA
jgi:2-oxoglutarate dehydrogenase complex dehydrogenase (E1) component-like enzyme